MVPASPLYAKQNQDTEYWDLSLKELLKIEVNVGSKVDEAILESFPNSRYGDVYNFYATLNKIAMIDLVGISCLLVVSALKYVSSNN